MALSLRDIPRDSLILPWCRYLGITEVPFSYQFVGGLSILGVLARRQRWIDQVDWRVFPNQSVMFIGPSGIGKDTIINRVQKSVQGIEYLSHVPVVGGVTLESIHERLSRLGKTASAYIPAPEITAFFGKSDYQANLLTGITNLLSNGASVDITTKGAMQQAHGQPKLISEPTITMHAGSTVEWLHKGMPEGTLEGGFLGRFLIVVEELGGRMVPLVKANRTRQELQDLRDSLALWDAGLVELCNAMVRPREVILSVEAEASYTNWYYNRFKQFSRAVMPYANRSRDMVLRLAMLVALSRLRTRYVDESDMDLALRIIADVADRIDRVVLPPSKEAQVAAKILEILPATIPEVYAALGERFEIKRQIDPAMDMLRATGRIMLNKKGLIQIVNTYSET